MIEDFRNADGFTDHRTFCLYCLVKKNEEISIAAYHFCSDMVKYKVVQDLVDGRPLDFTDAVVNCLADSVHEHWVRWKTNKSEWMDSVCMNH